MAIMLTRDATSNEYRYHFDIGLKLCISTELHMILYNQS